MRITSPTAVLTAGIIAGSLACAAPAGAAVTSSSVRVTSPTGTYVTFDEVSGAETMSISGSSNGAAGERVDINCYEANKRFPVEEGVELHAGGSFSFSGSFAAIADRTCVLRAVPHGDTTDYPPGSTSAYQGPTLAVGRRADTAIESGPNKGTLLLYYLYSSQLAGGFDYRSLGDCSILDSYTYDPLTFAPSRLDDCNATFWWQNGANGVPGVATPTRSEIQVDGANAYLPANAAEIFSGAQNDPGFPALRYRYAIDPATGNLVIEETDQLVRCAPGPTTYPPTAASCASFVPTGVEAYMAITQGGNGRIATVTQWFYSTDGAAHTVDLLEHNQFAHINQDGELNLPWTGEGLTKYTSAGQQLPAPPGAPASLFIKGSASVPDGGEESPQGALTFSNPPEGETIVGSTINGESWIDLHYRRSIPAGGPADAVALGFTYSNAFRLSEVEALAAAAQAAYAPKLAITGPANGTVSAGAQVTVTGTATDQTAIGSLVVDGRTVPVAADGTWSLTLPLDIGANTITATLTNVFGNSAQAHIGVTYAPVAPTVLTLHGKARASFKRGPRGVSFELTCQAPAGTACDGAAALTTYEHERGKRITAISARRRRPRKPPPARRVAITTGVRTFSIPAGATQTIFVSLNKAGERLLTRFHALPVALTVASTNGSGGPTLLARELLLIRPAAKPARKRHAPSRHGHGKRRR